MPLPIPEKKAGSSDLPEFLKLTPGVHFVRFLTPPEEVYVVYTHFIQGKYLVKCSDDCIICENNKKIIAENPDNFRNVHGYYPRSIRYFVNVLDRTSVKICPNPNCKEEVVGNAAKSFPTVCPKCGTFLAEAQPAVLNKVKIFGFGVDLATAINNIEASAVDANGDIIGITNYDISLSVVGTGRERKVTPLPAMNRNDKIDLTGLVLHDLSKAVVDLSKDEIRDLLRGVSLSDIYRARQPKPAVENSKVADITSRINELLD